MLITMDPVDTIANALIPLITIKREREISYPKAQKYEQIVVKELQKKNISVYHLHLSDLEEHIEERYSKYFYTKSSGSSLIIGTKNNISANDLRDAFRINIPLDALGAYVCSDALTFLFNENN